MKTHRTWIEISERSIVHNIKTMRDLLEDGARFCAVIKGNAYGHGMMEVAQVAYREGVNSFAVDTIDDAILLRKQYPTIQIIVLGYTLFDRFKDAVSHNIEITLYDKEGIQHGQKVAMDMARTLNVHLKLETGTTRQGVQPERLGELARLLQRMDHVRVVGCSTHFANIEDSQKPEYATLQFSRFQEMLAELHSYEIQPEWIHTACSAAIFLYPQTHQTLVRAGISLYGLWSSEHVRTTLRQVGIGSELKPVLTWKTRIAQVKNVAMGTPIGYGLTESMKRGGRIAVLPVGYWDGYDRALSSVGEVLIKGHRCKVMGRVCMNMMMVDVSQVPDPQKEDEVVLLGISGRHKITAEDLAQKCDTISYEIITRINPNLPRVLVH